MHQQMFGEYSTKRKSKNMCVELRGYTARVYVYMSEHFVYKDPTYIRNIYVNIASIYAEKINDLLR